MYPSKNQNPFFTQNQLVKMKNLIVLLLLLVNVAAVEAQYQISAELIPNTPSYKCTIVPTTGAFEYLDLITWILPDGQFKQQEIGKDANGNVINFATFTWTPYVDPTPNNPDPDKIQAFVAEKGGTGTPPPYSYDFLGQFGTTLLPTIFPTTQDFQLNRSWEFSRDAETFLIFTYQPKTLCSGNTSEEIRLNYPSHLTFLSNSYQSFNNEMIMDFSSQGYLLISNFTYNQDEQRHIFLKFKTNPLTPINQAIQITAQGKFCDTPQFVVYNCTTALHPHDPNKKTVDIDTICSNQPSNIKLTYTIQFHNDGKSPVKKVVVTDMLPQELLPTPFTLNCPPLNGIDGFIEDQPSGANDEIKKITFSGAGLPGLGQTSPSYSYDQTIYRFTFEVNTISDFHTIIDNDAAIIFYDDNGALPTIFTNVARVIAVDPGPGIDCYVPTTEAPDILGTLVLKPNPFSDQIDISFELKEKSKLNVEVRDILGNLIESVATGEYAAGPQQFVWVGTAVPDGVYLIFLRTEKGLLAKKVVKVR